MEGAMAPAKPRGSRGRFFLLFSQKPIRMILFSALLTKVTDARKVLKPGKW